MLVYFVDVLGIMVNCSIGLVAVLVVFFSIGGYFASIVRTC